MKDALARVIKLNFWFQFFEKSQKTLKIEKNIYITCNIKLEYKISRDKSLTKAKSRSSDVDQTI